MSILACFITCLSYTEKERSRNKDLRSHPWASNSGPLAQEVTRHFHQTDSIVLKTDHRISQSCCFLFAQDQITKLRAEVSQLKEREESLKSQVGPVLTSLCYEKRLLS